MPSTESPARRRLLDSAGDLFYAEGIHRVGIDRIIASADIAKATFYKHFPSKDDLVCAYLRERLARQQNAVAQVRETAQSLDFLYALFDAVGSLACGPGYRGCPFINAAAEYPDPGHPVREVIGEFRTWFVSVLRTALIESGRSAPDEKAYLLMVLRDGLAVGIELDNVQDVQATVRTMVRQVLD